MNGSGMTKRRTRNAQFACGDMRNSVAGLLSRRGYLLGVGAIVVPALFIVQSAASSASLLAQACANDIKRVCAGVNPGGGALK